MCRVEQQLVDEHVDVDIIKVKVAFLPVNPDASTLQVGIVVFERRKRRGRKKLFLQNKPKVLS